MIEGRNIIIWFSEKEAPRELCDVIAGNGLEMVSIDKLSKIGNTLWQSKGLIIEGSKPTFISGILRKVLSETGLHSVPIAMTNLESPNTDEQWALRIMKSVSKFLNNENIENIRYVRQYSPQEWVRLIKQFIEFKHGPVYSENLKIIKDDSVRKYHPEYIKDEFLIKRAFSHLEHIEIGRLKGGHSGARIYRVTPTVKDHSNRAIPFLIKIDKPEKIAQEKDIIETFVAQTISFQHRPNVFSNLCFATPEAGVLVQDFIENAIPLQKAIKHGRAAMLITSLFEGALQPWRLNPTDGKKEILINHFFPGSEFKCCKDPRALEEAYNWACAEANATIDTGHLFSKLKSCAPDYCSVGRIHGDLHCNNIFVGAGSHDIVLIDFCMSSIGPTVSDSACLEVDIALRSGCSKDFLEGLYAPPLVPPPPPVRNNQLPWVWEAVRAIRLFGKINSKDNDAYTYAVAAHLLKFSSYEDNGSVEIRGIAYAAAEKLIISLCH